MVGEHLLIYHAEQDWRAAGGVLTVIGLGLLALKAVQKLRRKAAIRSLQTAAVKEQPIGVRS